MAIALVRHETIVAGVVGEHGGRLVKNRGEGDSALAVFASPTDALDAALHLQAQLADESWPGRLPIRTRMGLHAGPVQVRGDDLFGPTVNLASRAAGRGGRRPGGVLGVVRRGRRAGRWAPLRAARPRSPGTEGRPSARAGHARRPSRSRPARRCSCSGRRASGGSGERRSRGDVAGAAPSVPPPPARLGARRPHRRARAAATALAAGRRRRLGIGGRERRGGHRQDPTRRRAGHRCVRRRGHRARDAVPRADAAPVRADHGAGAPGARARARGGPHRVAGADARRAGALRAGRRRGRARRSGSGRSRARRLPPLPGGARPARASSPAVGRCSSSSRTSS